MKKNENKVAETVERMMDKLDAPSVKVARCAFLPALEYSKFDKDSSLVDAMKELDSSISAYASCKTEEERKEGKALIAIKTESVNKVYKSLQIAAMAKEGARAYLAAPFFKAVVVKFDKDGNYKEKDYAKRPMLPVDMPEGFFASDFLAKSKLVMAACLGYHSSNDLALRDNDGNSFVKSSNTAIKDYMTESLRAVLGDDCHFQVRSKDVAAMKLSCVNRVSYLSSTFKKTKTDVFAWYLIDSLGAALHGTNYTIK